MSPFARGAGWGLAVGLVWLTTEALWLAASGRDVGVGWWMFGLGVCAPALAAMALACGAVADGWARTLAAGRREAAAAWLRRRGDDVALDHSATVVVALAMLALGGALSVVLGEQVVVRVRTPRFAAIVELAIQVALLVTLSSIAPAVRHQAVRAAAWLGQQAPRLTRGLSAARVLWAALLVASLVAVGWSVKRRALVLALPLERGMGPLAGMSLATLASLLLGRRAIARVWLRWWLRLGALLLVFAAVAAWWLPARARPWRDAMVATSSTPRVLLSSFRRWLDFDGDGVSGFYGDGDCAPFDARRGPRQIEIPDNGIDEDCSGIDLHAGDRELIRGEARHGPPKGIATRPHLLLITTDALSHRHTGLGGYPRPVTPELDAFARRATLFEAAFTTGPATESALPALFTGTFASVVPSLTSRFVPEQRPYAWPATLASTLQAVGYRTHAILGTDSFSAEKWPGLTHGFERVDVRAQADALARRPGSKPHTSAELVERALAVIEEPHDRPLFLWVHFFDHHPIYAVPPGEESFASGGREVDRYDSELHYSDRHWGVLLRAIEKRWAPEEYMLVFTSDHGEAFDVNHDREHHAHCVRSEEVHVPFLVQGPRQRGKRVQGLVSHFDVMPTFLDLAGVPSPRELLGESLIPTLFEGRPPQKNTVFAVSFDPFQGRTSGEPFLQIGVRDEHFHLLDDRTTGAQQLFRWTEDPVESDDVSSTEAQAFEWFRYLANQQLAWMRERYDQRVFGWSR